MKLSGLEPKHRYPGHEQEVQPNRQLSHAYELHQRKYGFNIPDLVRPIILIAKHSYITPDPQILLTAQH
jgi:hypothetical protein